MFIKRDFPNYTWKQGGSNYVRVTKPNLFRFDYSPFLRGTPRRKVDLGKKRGVGGGERDRRLRHAMVYIRPDSSRVQIVPSPFSLSPSLPRFLRVSLFRIAKTRYSLDRYAPRLSLFLASRTPTPRLCGRERSISRWNRGRTISTSLLHLFPPFFRPLLLLSHPLRNFC